MVTQLQPTQPASMPLNGSALVVHKQFLTASVRPPPPTRLSRAHPGAGTSTPRASWRWHQHPSAYTPRVAPAACAHAQALSQVYMNCTAGIITSNGDKVQPLDVQTITMYNRLVSEDSVVIASIADFGVRARARRRAPPPRPSSTVRMTVWKPGLWGLRPRD